MKKLFFTVISLLVLGFGGILKADEQDVRDEITLISYFDQPGEYTLGVTFSGTPGEKFLIQWWNKQDTISVENADEIKISRDIIQTTSESTPYYVSIYAINPTGHILSLSIDSAYKYTDLYLKQCPELTTLQVPHNNLSVLVLAGCRDLKFLDCSYNRLSSIDYLIKAEFLTYLDFSHNPMDYLNRTTNLSNFLALQHLICNNTLMEGLNLSDMPFLETVQCADNPLLGGFGLANMPALKMVQCADNPLLERLAFTDFPSLDSLDFSDNVQLKELFINNTKLRSLDLSVAPNLEGLWCNGNDSLTMLKANNPALETLYCAHNQLETLFLDNAPVLKDLHCNHNQLETLFLDNAPVLKDLHCNHNRLASLHLPSDVVLDYLRCDSNRFQLSALTDLVKQVDYTRFDLLSPQLVPPVLRQVGQTLDLHEEMRLEFPESQWYLWDSAGHYYDIAPQDIVAFNDGRFSFKQTGRYRIEMIHNGLFDHSENTHQAIVCYDVTVVDSVARPVFSPCSGAVKPHTPVSLSTSTPDARIYYTVDGSVPDSTALLYTAPISIDEEITIKAISILDTLTSRVAMASYRITDTTTDTTTDNEYNGLAHLNIYAKDKMIYIPESIGKVEVFTANGQCVYRGSATAIPVKRSGLYVVVAKGGRWKVAVR